MICCHSLSNLNGQVIGDPLEVSMFKHTGYQLDDKEVASNHQ